MNTPNENRLNEVFDELVPMTGAAETVAGEIVRAACRIGHRYYNDGDEIGLNYGNETCNAPARYLVKMVGGEVADIICYLNGGAVDYEQKLSELAGAVLAHLDEHPELKEEKNTDNIWNYQEPEDEEWDAEFYEDDWDEDNEW